MVDPNYLLIQKSALFLIFAILVLSSTSEIHRKYSRVKVNKVGHVIKIVTNYCHTLIPTFNFSY